RHRWNGQAAGPAGRPAAPLTPAERTAIWDHVTRTAAAATEQIRQLSAIDPGLAADAAWAAADTFHAAASALGSRVLRQAADSYAAAGRLHTARCAYERWPTPQRAQGRPPAAVAEAAFPFSIHDVLARGAATARARAPASPRRASPAPMTPRQRGPTP